MADHAEHMIRDWEKMKSGRHNWDSQWQEVHDLVWPDGGDFTLERSAGEVRTERIYDSHAMGAVEKMASYLENTLTPRETIWHGLRASNKELAKEHEVKIYFEKLQNMLFHGRSRPGANFYNQKNEGYKSLVAYGNDCFNPMPDVRGRGISYKYVHIGSVWVETDPRSRINYTVYMFKLSHKAALEKWGDQAPKSVHDKVKESPFDEQEYLHAVKPRKDWQPDAIGPKGMEFESWEISLKDKEFIQVKSPFDGHLEESSGFRTHPYVYSRFTVNPAEKHGRGPAMLTLSNNRTLQSQWRTQIISGQLATEPPILSMDDALLAGTDADEGFNLVPGAINPGGLDASGRPRFLAFNNGYRHDLSTDLMQINRDTIDDFHFVKVFEALIDNPEMTAFEVAARLREKGQRINPMVGRQNTEMLGPLIVRELDIYGEMGLLPEIPGILLEAEGEYDIEYTSEATRIQKEEKVQQVLSGVETAIPMMELDPGVRHDMNFREINRFIQEERGMPPELMRSKEDADDLIAQENQQNAQREAAEQLPGMAKAASDANDAGLINDEIREAMTQGA